MENSNNNQHGATNDDVLVAINDFASQTEHRFINLENDVNGIKGEINGIKEVMATKSDLDGLETRMVSKAYLDDKLADQTVEIFSRLNQRQNKDRNFKETLVRAMKGHALITPKEEKSLKDLI